LGKRISICQGKERRNGGGWFPRLEPWAEFREAWVRRWRFWIDERAIVRAIYCDLLDFICD
jgi:hypothetical protein